MSLSAPNYTKLSNEFVEKYMNKVSGSACKIFCAISRKTIGWHKERDSASYSQLKEMTGITSYSTIQKAVEELEKLDLITVEKRPGKTTLYDINISDTFTENVKDLSNNCKSTFTKTVNTKESKEKEKATSVACDKRKQPHPSVKPLILYFAESYKKRTSTEATINWGAWGKIFKTFLGVHPEDEIILVVDYFFAYEKRTDFTVYSFSKRFDALAPKAINGSAAKVVKNWEDADPAYHEK